MSEEQMNKRPTQYRITYRHDDCPIAPGIEWQDVWDCACNGECPACKTKDIEPIDWVKL